MEEWLHCNFCGVRFSSKFCSFVVTTCAHIFCSKCEEKATRPHCSVCQQKCKLTQLNDKIPAAIAEFFKPPSDLRKKAIDLLKRADEATKFQNNQFKLLRKFEVGKFEEQSKFVQGAMHTIEQLQKENIETKKFLRNKANISSSPIDSRCSSRRSPVNVSPRQSPSISPRRSQSISPNHGLCKSSTQYYTNIPCSPNKSMSDGYQHSNVAKQYKSPGEGVKRVSMRSPPVDGRLCMQSPNSISPNRGHPYKLSDGVISKQASIGSRGGIGSTGNKYFNYPSPKSCGSTPPTTPKYQIPRGYSSCPITPENKFFSRFDSKR